MNQRLVWNFEFSSNKPPPLTRLEIKNKEDLKWEARFFWPDDQIITLYAVDKASLDLALYEQKHKEDDYYLLPDSNYNIKLRRNELLYKPILKQTPYATGFGAKTNLSTITCHSNEQNQSTLNLDKVMQQAKELGTVVHVKKESFIYKFQTSPTIKLELARLEVHDKVYFSACVEGRSLYLVEKISEHLLDKQVSCDYVTFLKNNLRI
jgi:hypothetical protein